MEMEKQSEYSLCDKWQTLQKSLENHLVEMDVKEAEFGKRMLELEEREKELGRRYEDVELKERVNDEFSLAIQYENDRFVERGLELERRSQEVQDRVRAVELKEKEFEERFQNVVTKENEVEERFEALPQVLKSKEKEVEESFRVVESREREIEERLGVVESKEKEIEELVRAVESKEKEIEEGFVGLRSKEKDIKKRLEEVELKEKGIEERNAVVGSKEKGIEERLQEVELRERGVEEGLLDLGMKKMEMDSSNERCVKELEERSRAIKLEEDKLLIREKEVFEFSQRLEYKEKKLVWEKQEVEFNKEQVGKRREALLLWEREINEGRPCSFPEELGECQLKEKQVEGLLRELELKEKLLDERSKALDLKEGLIDEHCMVEELREKETDERCREIREQNMELQRRESEIRERLREIELREGVMDERSKGLDLQEKKLDGLNKEVELKQKGFNEQRRGLISEENRISRARMELEREQDLKFKKLNEDSDSLKAKERQIDTRLQELNSMTESKVIEIKAILEVLEVKQKTAEDYSDSLKVKERQIDDRMLELSLTESKMKEVDATLVKLEAEKKLVEEYKNQLDEVDNLLKEKGEKLEVEKMQNNEHSEVLKIRQKEIENKGLELEAKEKEFNQRCQEHEIKEQVIAGVPMVETEGLWSELKVDDGETLQLVLNDRFDEHSFMGEVVLKVLKSYDDPPGFVLSALNGFFPPHLRKGNVEYAARTVMSSCVLLLEQLMNMRPEVCKNVTVKAEETACLWRQKMQENGERRTVVLGFLLLVVAFRIIPKFERDELKRLWEIVNQHRLAPKLRQELDLFEECQASLEYSASSQSDIEQHHSGSVITDDMDSCSEIQSACSNMDASCLRSYLNKHVMDHKLFPRKIANALRASPDPALLVFKVLQSFNLPQASIIDKTSCIFLLEQMTKLQRHQSTRNPLGEVEQVSDAPLQITRDMRINALAFASGWKSQLTTEGLKPLEVYGFLQFLASYKLASLYDEDEILELFKVLYSAHPVYWPEENPHLCRALGLTDKIPGLITSLIKEDCRLQAAKYIYTFMEEPHFPLSLLLKDHVKFIQQRVEKIREISDRSTEKIKVTFELKHLREVLQYIKDYKLEQEYSPTTLESRIIQLGALMSGMKTDATKAPTKSIKLPVIEMKLEKKAKIPSVKNSEPHSHGVTKRQCQANTPTSEVLQEGKRFKVEAVKTPTRPNISFKIPSVQNSFLPRQMVQSCPRGPATQASPSKHPAQHPKMTSTTRSTSMPGAVYSVAVAPYGEVEFQDTP